MEYFDTAFIAKIYLRENGSEAILEKVGQLDAIACSAHGRVELAYVFHREYRENGIDRQGLRARMKLVEEDTAAGRLHWLPMDEELLKAARGAVLSLERTIPLRAADALHLVSARDHGFSRIFSNDRHLLSGASSFGLTGCNLIPDDP